MTKLFFYSSLEKNHGRIEKRICKKINSSDWLQERHNWPGLKTVFCVERIITKGIKTTKDVGYYITIYSALKFCKNLYFLLQNM